MKTLEKSSKFSEEPFRMSLTVQQLLSDAKRLSSRLRDHDQSADHLISRAQEVLKEVDAMRQYQEDVENLNEVAHNRPRAQLVLGIQQENRHIRTLQQENKELRAALEEHQNALELIMSKYRQHVTRLVNAPHPDFNNINNYKIQMLAEKTEKVCEMASVMKEAVRVDEDVCNEQQELMARLVTENKGLRELLSISQRSLSSTPRVRKVTPTIHKEVQTEVDVVVKSEEEGVQTVTLPRPGLQNGARPGTAKVTSVDPLSPVSPEVISSTSPLPNVSDESGRVSAELSSGDSDETGSEDESVKFDTIQRAGRRRTVIPKEKEEEDKTTEPSDGRLEGKIEPGEEVLSVEHEVTEENKATMDSVVAGLVRQLVSDTVDSSDNVKITTNTESNVSKETADELNTVGNTPLAENTISEKLVAKSDDKLVTKSDDKPTIESDVRLKVEADNNKPKTESKDSSAEKSDNKSDVSCKATASDSTSSVDKSDSDLPNTELAQTKAPADTSKPTQSHTRSNSRGKKANTNKNSPKKKKNS